MELYDAKYCIRALSREQTTIREQTRSDIIDMFLVEEVTNDLNVEFDKVLTFLIFSWYQVTNP